MEQFGLDHLWTNADVVQKAVAILLVIMSAMSWYVIAFKSWSLARCRRRTSRDHRCQPGTEAAQEDPPTNRRC